ncbi:MAG: molybdenum cofactor biosynthesis protein MoaE [Deltaproteobacteria bacterium]|nr:molybdenum cofactor biosynthesis protein MoaE [Deltaproteobacteria bacterium]
MELQTLIDQVKKNERYEEAGMILCHNGVVRSTSRGGKRVKGLKIKSDRAKLDEIIAKYKQNKGIVEILVHIAEDDTMLVVGDDVMFIVVAGDIRETVIATLTDVLNEIKKEVTSKTEFFSVE